MREGGLLAEPRHWPRDVDLLELVREINAVLDPEELLPTIARLIRRVVDYRVLDIFLPQDDGALRPVHVEGYPLDAAGVRASVRPGEGIVGLAAQERQAFFVPDVASDPRYRPVVSGVGAAIAVPLVHGDRLVGVLNVEARDAVAFGDGRWETLCQLASHMAVAVGNAKVYRELRIYAGLLGTLYEAGRETATIFDVDQLLTRVAEIVKRVIDYEMFGILLLEESSGWLVLRKAVRFGSIQEKQRIHVSQGLCGAAVREKRPILVSDVDSDERYVRLIPGVRSELVVPLIHKDRVLGVFDLESSELGRFTEEHLQTLTPLANQVAGAFESARLYGEVQRNEVRLQRELAIARNVQVGLLPEDPPEGRGFEASAQFRPALELGGDLFDFYSIGEGELGVAVGDVAGKGVPAALFGAFVSGTLRGRAFEKRGPAELVTRVNRTLRNRNVEGLYCALTYAYFDFRNAIVSVAASGLPYPLRYSKGTGRCEKVVVAGLPLGLFDEGPWEEQQIPLEPGDVFVFYTDGVSEADGGDGEFGVVRLAQIVENLAEKSAGEIGSEIVSSVESYLGTVPPSDDVTVVVVKVKP